MIDELFFVGDKVRINHTCHESYWDIYGTIIDICEPDDDPLIYHVLFDKGQEERLGTLEDEYFALDELDKI